MDEEKGKTAETRTDTEALKEVLRYDELWCEIIAQYGEWAKKQGISYHELVTAYSIWLAPCTQRDIVIRWAIPKQTVHSILREFQKHDYIFLERSKTDKRNKHIFFNARGKEKFGPVMNRLIDLELRVWKRLKKEETRALLSFTEKYSTCFREEARKEETESNAEQA